MLIGNYQNGNYDVKIYSDGTKIRETDESAFVPEFPESMDLKITDYCDQGCAFCHENSSVCGQHGDILNLEFIDTLKPYTELAIGGGDPVSHPNLIPFLKLLRQRKLIANVTVHQSCFVKNEQTLRELVSQRLIHGLGVSIHAPTDDLLEKVAWFKNAVIHVVNGVITMDDFEKMYDKNLKVLILGYKNFRRGEDFYSEEVFNRMRQMYNTIPDALEHFNVVSFDNLAIKQLDVKLLMTDEEWRSFYMGDDGGFTMYIDAVKREYAKNSTSTERFPITENIIDMFNKIKQNSD